MTTMSDDGDRTCPLCAEDMDLTDQQLKPCKCGYEVCVWCWHHIMEMAEKEGSEGRCPACRTAYDKQRIVGMAANCKRMVAEISAEKKQKSQKIKNKSSSAIEDRKHLSSVRVVQRNLVYIMGMPSNLADENILERKEYFGQYGKILKVSVSRQPGITPQQAANNNTFSVYITYAKEEEAIRCIQAAHNFILEGKPLRACFGTTKYCYTWLRNMTCSNPDCLYLHDIGSHEDSFTKDEIISAYTRSRVPHMPSNNLQPRAGNVLPPPVDDLYNNGAVSAKHSIKSSLINATNQAKSAPIETSGPPRTTVLPAAASWGLRSSNCRSPASSFSPASSLTCSQHPLKQKMEVLTTSSSSSVVSNTKQNSAWHDDVVTASKTSDGRHGVHMDSRPRTLEPSKHCDGRDHPIIVSDVSSGPDLDVDHSSSSAWDDDVTVTRIPDEKHTMNSNGRSISVGALRPADTVSTLDTSEEIVLDDARPSAWDDDTISTLPILGERQTVHNDDRFRSSETRDCGSGRSRIPASDLTSKASDAILTSGVSGGCSPSLLPPQHENSDRVIASVCRTDPVNITYAEGATHQSSSSFANELTQSNAVVNGSSNTENLCAGLSSVNLDIPLGLDHISRGQQQQSLIDDRLVGKLGNLNSRLPQYYPENKTECLTSVPMNNTSIIPDSHDSGDLSDWRSQHPKQGLLSKSNGVEHVFAATDDRVQMLSVPTSLSSCLSSRTFSSNVTDDVGGSRQNGDIDDSRFSTDVDSRVRGVKVNKDESLFLNGRMNGMPHNSFEERMFERPNFSYTEKQSCLSGSDGISNHQRTANADKDEENIVSKILSSDFDPWDNSWSSANNFAKLLGQMNKQEGSSKQSSTWKPQNSNQSRFSFARQENQANLGDNSYRDAGLAQQLVSSKQESYGNFVGNTFPISNFDRANIFGNSSSAILPDAGAGVMRTKISAPPGFSVPNRAPPPGFSSQDRYEQAFNSCSETQVLGSSLQNQFQVNSNSNAVDVEFIDPAILAVGKGRLPLGVNSTGLGSRSAFHPQFSTSEADARMQLLMQQTISANQESRIPNHIGDRFLQLDDAYTASRFSAQNPTLSPFAQLPHQQPSHILNNQWNGWNDIQIGNGMGIPEVLRNERFGLNNYFPVNDEPKFHLPRSGDIYNRAFGM